jgi:hypothetical protein
VRAIQTSHLRMMQDAPLKRIGVFACTNIAGGGLIAHGIPSALMRVCVNTHPTLISRVPPSPSPFFPCVQWFLVSGRGPRFHRRRYRVFVPSSCTEQAQITVGGLLPLIGVHLPADDAAETLD